MKDLHDGLGVENMSDLILKIYMAGMGTKNLTKEQISRYKMTKKEIYEKYDKLSENELNKKSNKKFKDDIKHCRGKKR